MKRVAAVILAGVLSTGCATIPTAEKAWHTMNFVDMAQTLHVANSPECYRESNFLTKAIIGESPSAGAVVGVMVGYSLLFHYASKWIREKHPEFSKPWYFANLAFKAGTIIHNHNVGVRPFGSGC